MKVILSFLLLFITIICETEDQKYYFQLYPSQDKDKPYLFYAYTPPSNFITINTTEKDNCAIIANSEISESAIKNLSSVIIYNNDLLIKTCFNPNILIEIKNDQVNLNKKKSKILSNVKYCYSTVIYSPDIKNNQIEYAIFTYWIEYELKSGKEIYTHKCMIYYINYQIFSVEINLKTTKNFYSEKCINLRGTDIFCSISSDEFTNINYFVIETKKLFSNDNNHLVSSNAAYEKDVYQKILSTDLGLYDNQKEYYYDIFIIEYHNKLKDVTKLNFQLYKKGESRSLSFSEAKFSFSELYIEQTYIDPSLFNMLFQRANDTIITYIMKAGKKTNYLLSRFNLAKSTEKKNYNQLVSNYLRDDICSNPKYMQSSFMTSFINYNDAEKAKIKQNGEQNYYKYQKDLVSLITCLNKDNKVEYEPKKIVLPQCLNILDELNNKNYHVIEFTPDKNQFVLDIKNDPKYKSLKNVGIQFLSPEVMDKIIINYKKANSANYEVLGGNQFNEVLTSVSQIIFTKTTKMKLNKPITLYYRLIQSIMSEDGKTITCHLSSDKCELKLEFKEKAGVSPGPGGGDIIIDQGNFCPVPYCDYCDDGKCQKCEVIEGIILNKDLNKCICDVRKGFKEEPDEINKMCVCKEGYSYFKNRKQCLPNYYLEECKCFLRNDDLSLIPIYDDCPKDKTILEENGRCVIIDESFCFDINNLDMNLWFKLGEYKFYFAKINDCVYIFDSQNLTLFFYSNREDCSFENDIMIRFIRECLNKPEITGVKEYMAFLNSAKEYEPNATDITIFKKIEKKDSKIKSIFFNLVNGQSQENVSDVILPEHIINEVKNISNISEELNLLVFKADMTRNDTISTQVEYQFYNPIPSKIHQKIIFKSLNDTNSRRLEYDDDDGDDGIGIHIETDDFKLRLNLPIQWSEEEEDIIGELYKEKHIFVFNSSNPFFLDVCYKYTTSYDADIYLEDRKEKYYIQHPFCEEGCSLIDGQNYDSKKLTCQCITKNINDNYTNITFYEIEPDEEFKKEYKLPNFKVMGCFGDVLREQNLLKSFIFYINFAMVLAYISFYCIKRICNKESNPFKELIHIIEDELKDFKYNYLGIEQEDEIEDNENHEHSEDQTKYEKDKIDEEEKIKAYADNDDNNNNNNDNNNNDNNNNNNDNNNNNNDNNNNDNDNENEQTKLLHNQKNSIENIRENEKNNVFDNQKDKKGILTLKENKKNKDMSKESQNKNDEQNYKSDDQILINNDGNDSQTIGNKKDLIDGPQESEKITLNLIENEPENNLISGNSKSDNLFKSEYEEEPSKDYDNNSEIKANPPKNSSLNKYSDKNQNETQKRKDTSVNENDNKNNINNIYNYNQEPVDSNSKIKTPIKENYKQYYLDKKKEYSEEIIDRAEYKDALTLEKSLAEEPESGRAFCQMFKTMISHNDTIYFVIRCNDKNDNYIKITVCILSVYLYIFVNLLIMVKGPSLHLYLRKDKGKFSFLSLLVNFLLPYIIFYFSILKLKNDLSIEEFLNDKYYQLYNILLKYTNLKKSLNKNNIKKKYEIALKEKEETIKYRIKNELIGEIHNLEAEISKKLNEYQKEKQKLFWGGLILILLSWYYMICFLGIYENSYDCLFMNLFMSVVSSFIVSIIVYLISTSFRKYAIEKKNGFMFKISEYFNPQNKYFCFKHICSCCFSCFFFKHISCICSKICCCCYNENEIKDYIEKIRKKDKKNIKKKKIEKNLKNNDENNEDTNAISNTEKSSLSNNSKVIQYSEKIHN